MTSQETSGCSGQDSRGPADVKRNRPVATRWSPQAHRARRAQLGTSGSRGSPRRERSTFDSWMPSFVAPTAAASPHSTGA